MRMLVAAGVFIVLLGPLYPAAYFGPHYWAQLEMEEVAQVSVLAWRTSPRPRHGTGCPSR